MEKFVNIVCRLGHLAPAAAVLVVTVRAIKYHGGLIDRRENDRAVSLNAIEIGMANVRRHLNTIRSFGLPPVLAVNRRAVDSDEEIALVRQLALEAGAFAAEVNDGFAQGGRVRGTWRRPSSPPADSRERSGTATATRHRSTRRSRPWPSASTGPKTSFSTRRPSRRSGNSPGTGWTPPGMRRQNTPVAVCRRVVAQRARELHDSRARRARLHRRGLARTVVRGAHPDAGTRRRAHGAER